jgi:hypothetical protein
MFYSEEEVTTTLPRVNKSQMEKSVINRALYNNAAVVKDLITGILGDDILRDFNMSSQIKSRTITNGMEIIISLTPDELLDDDTLVERSRDASEFARLSRRYDIPKNWFGRRFKYGNNNCRVASINPKAHSYPIICDRWNQYGRYSKIKMSVRDLKSYILNG